MTIYARVEGGFVVELFETSGDITELFHHDLVWVEVGDKNISCGWSYIEGEFHPPIATNRTANKLLADVSLKRWLVETGGILVAGIPIKTDRESQAQIFSVYASLNIGIINDTVWKNADGSFVMATISQMEPIAKAVAEHVRACFAAEETHFTSIYALQNQADIDAYDIDAGWPI
ncbi:DUF4376 domain-containing protein [Aeromonas veronii]|uniref:DUF4376 domain-containing protein n=1 Tax=Aeromonas veronii TaxID=654 RepID=UPI003D1EF773